VLGATSGDFRPRVVVDEASFDFRNVPDTDVEGSLDQFNDALDTLRQEGQQAAVFSDYCSVECRDGLKLLDLLYSRATHVDPDVCRRTGVLLDRCPTWDDDEVPVGYDIVELPETPIPAFSAGYALTMVLGGRAVGCLVVPTCPRKGSLRLNNRLGGTEVIFLTEASEIHRVWRHAFALENVSEREFFTVAAFAFPSLAFHPNLRFGKFAGNYTAVRQSVVRILCALNDHFPRVFSERRGIPRDVDAAMGQYGVNVSPESPNTHASSAFMRERDVMYNGSTYCCEWHAKIEGHRNRIHFTLPTTGPGGRILIGIFTEHLDV
jgi:hypothetical protein